MKTQFTGLFRIWHWLLAFSVIGLLFTVLLRKTFLSYKSNALIIQEKLAAVDIDLQIESAKAVAKAIRAPMWEWHYIFGLFLGVAILLRIYLTVTKKVVDPVTRFRAAPKEEKLQRGVYLLLSIVIVLMALSGAVLYFHESLGIEKNTAHTVKELHEMMMYGVLGLVFLHLAGVIRHELLTKEGIVSKMIHGD